MTWTKINDNRDNLPTDVDNDKLYLFAAFTEDFPINYAEFDTWANIKKYRKEFLTDSYTHYMEVGRPEK